MKLFLLISLMLAITLLSHAQLITNGSLEGETGINLPPNGWYSCKEFSTPDVHGANTNFWNITATAAHGNTCLGLITRANIELDFMNYTTEAIGTTLVEPFVNGNCYLVTLSLAASPDMRYENGGIWHYFNNPVVLNVYGGDAECDLTNKIWSSPPVSHPDWRKYSFQIDPEFDINTLVLEAAYPGEEPTHGNILIDNISIEMKGLDLPDETFIMCEGDTHTIGLTDQYDDVTWSNGSHDNAITISHEGAHWVTTNIGTCVLVDTVYANEIPTIPTYEDEVLTVCEGESQVISVSQQEANFQWSTGDTTSEIVVQQAGAYTVAISNVCSESAKNFIIEVDDQCCALTAPNIFTPNGDTKNDVFEIFSGRSVNTYKLEIVNRWGSKVFTSNDVTDFWNGTSHSKECATGVYYWTATFKCLSNGSDTSNQYKGVISLMR